MPLDKELIKRLIATFAIELDEQCQVITDKLLYIEQNQCSEDDLDTIYNVIFRSAHNIKGAARGVEQQEVADIAHNLESLFSQLKKHKQSPQSTTIDLCLKALDTMRSVLTAKRNNTALPEDLSSLTEQLKLSKLPDSATPAERTTPTKSTTPAESNEPNTTESEVVTPESTVLEGTPPKEIQSDHIIFENTTPAELSQPKTEKATATPPSSENSKPLKAHPSHSRPSTIGSKTTEVVKITLDKLTKIDALSEELQVAKIEMENHLMSLNQLRLSVQEFLSDWNNAIPAWRRMATEIVPPEVSRLFSGSNKTVSTINNITSSLYKNLRSTSNQLGVLSTALQGDVRIMRLVPAATLFTPLTRTVRDIARELGKEIHLVISGDDIEIDRSVLEGIHDPVVHLLRNAIDHGIEAPPRSITMR